MKNYALFSLLGSLDKKELAAFSKYLRLQYGKEQIALEVFRYFKKYYPTFADERKMDLAYAYRKIFKVDIDEDRYNRKKLLNALSDLKSWLKEFLLLQKIRSKDSFESQAMWLTILRDRKMEVEFAAEVGRLKMKKEKEAPMGVKDFLDRVVTDHFMYGKKVLSYKPDMEALQSYGNNLDLCYLASRMKIACEMANLRNVRNADFKMGLLPAAIELGNSFLAGDYPLPKLYFKVFQLINDQEAGSYADITALLAANATVIDVREFHIVLSYLHNHAAAQIRRGKEEMYQELHLLNVFALEHGAFIRNGISPTQFHNIVSIASRANAYDWAISFVDNHQKYLPKIDVESIILLSKSIILFHKQEFAESLEIAVKIKSNDIRQTIRVKIIIVQCMYEINGEDNFELLDFCQTFEVFLRRNRSAVREIVEATSNFIKMVKMLLKMKKEKEKVLQEIRTISPVFVKPWLLKKTDTYRAKYAVR
ncbi:MAG: hypothetical protein AAFZ15_08375 [Bacteroidota bacterium]